MAGESHPASQHMEQNAQTASSLKGKYINELAHKNKELVTTRMVRF
jgi:hypothetical protein